MAVIIGLLDLQAAGMKDHFMQQMFNDIKGRIYAMSLVHEQLMQTRDLSMINLKEYIDRLVENLFEGWGAWTENIKTTLKMDAIPLSIDTAVPLGLVLNEIITNSLKYA